MLLVWLWLYKKITGDLFIKYMITSLDVLLFSFCLKRCLIHKNILEFIGIFGFFNEKKLTNVELQTL